MTPNQRVKILRTKLGLSQREFAGRANINHVHLAQIETGPAPRVGLTIAQRLLARFPGELKVLGWDLAELVTYPDDIQ